MNFLKSGFGSRNMIRCMKTHSLGRNCRHVAQSKQFLDFLHPCKPYPTPTTETMSEYRWDLHEEPNGKRKENSGARQLKDRYRNCQKLIGLCFWNHRSIPWTEQSHVKIYSYHQACINLIAYSRNVEVLQLSFWKKYLYLINNNLIKHWNWWH